MQVKHVIQASAEVVNVSQVHIGDIYKRIEKPPYGDERLVYGKVIDILANVEDAALVALEFVPQDYSTGIQAAIRTFSGNSEIALFPATIAEYELVLSNAIDAQEKLVMAARADYDAKVRIMDRMLEAMSEAKQELITEKVNVVHEISK